MGHDLEIKVTVTSGEVSLWYDASNDAYHMKVGDQQLVMTEANVERLMLALIQLRGIARGLRRGARAGSSGGGGGGGGA